MPFGEAFLNLDFTLFVGGWDGWNGTEIKQACIFFFILSYNIKHKPDMQPNVK